MRKGHKVSTEKCREILRLGVRVTSLGMAILAAAVDYWLNVFLHRGEGKIRARLSWQRRSARRFLAALNVQVRATGNPARRGLQVSNHLGYLDIPVFASVSPMFFVSKMEVREWPVFGWLASCAGTLFIDRTRRLDVERVGRQMSEVLGNGVVVALFPEGTSSGGGKVLPFRSSLLEPVAATGWPVTPACIAYEVPHGNAETDACYWGNMDFLTHLINLMKKKAVYATVTFGEPVETKLDRKQLAEKLHEEVADLTGWSKTVEPVVMQS